MYWKLSSSCNWGVQNMAKEDLVAVEEIAKDWSKQGAPAEVKLK